MAILTSTDKLTSLEVAKRSGFSPDARRIVEELNEYNELLLDAPVVEANEGTVDTHLVRTALPKGEFRGYNEGVGSKASQTKTIKDVISNIEIYSTVDKQMIDESAHPTEIMQSEQNAFIEGMAQMQANDIIYGDHNIDPRRTNGLATRLDKIGKYCIDMGGKGNNLTSVYLIKWGIDKARLIHPRGSQTIGVQYHYLGEQTVKDANGKEFQAYRAHYRMSYGLSVAHSASIIRLANIDLNTINGVDLAEKIVRVKPLLARGAGTVSIAMNPDLKGIMNVAAINKTNIILQADDPWGHEILKIGEARFRECPALINNEEQVM